MRRALMLTVGCVFGLFYSGGVHFQGAAAEIDTRPLAVESVRTFASLKIERPILVTYAPDGTNDIFIASQLGTVYWFPKSDDAKQAKKFFEIKTVFKSQEFEEGFLGLAFHPKFKENGQFFVCYTTPDVPHTTVISRFTVAKDNRRQGIRKSEQELMRIPKKYWNHNGGTILFGPDGYLYVALGDGGSANDPDKNGQNLGVIFGKILRIDVNSKSAGKAYGIPKDNPFVNVDKARPEIWSYGMRNPWRIAFDRETGVLWCGDVGQDKWEEIDLIVRGGNYGWSLREGAHPFGPQGSEAQPELIDPIFEYSHDIGKSITGGVVYRGKEVPGLAGKYLYADFVAGKLWALDYDMDRKQVIGNHEIQGNVMPVMSFGDDADGEVYFTTDKGTIHRFRSKKTAAAAREAG
jgi:glucose/arabinose dehydrogenase